MKAENFQRGFLLLLVTGITVIFVWMIRSFLVALLLAAIFSSLARPLYLRLLSLFGGRKPAASGVTLLAFVLLIILPLFGFLGIVANQAVKVTETVTPWVQEKLKNKEELDQRLKRLPGFSYVAPHSEEILKKVGGMVSGVG